MAGAALDLTPWQRGGEIDHDGKMIPAQYGGSCITWHPDRTIGWRHVVRVEPKHDVTGTL